MKDILERIEDSSPNESSHELICRLRDCADEITKLRAGLPHSDAEQAPVTTVLPDGSAFSVVSLPLPKDHWLYAPRCDEWDSARDTTADTPHPILTHEQRAAVVAAVRYAIRGATMCGTESDFDPDALVQNAVYALCGPYGALDETVAPGAAAQGEAVRVVVLKEAADVCDQISNDFNRRRKTSDNPSYMEGKSDGAEDCANRLLRMAAPSTGDQEASDA